MRGKPKYLNSKEDYLNLLAMDEAVVSKEEKIEELEGLLANISDWFFEKYVAENEGIEDETHKVVVNEPMEGSEQTEVTYAQYVYKQNPMAKIFRIGFTIEEVQNLIDSLK
jgi:hypothetical protein